MKKWLVAAGLTTTIFVTAACGSEEVNGQGPSDIPVQWANAHVQKDQGTMFELLLEEQTALDEEDKPDNELTVEDYKLTEWKINDERYLYEIVYEHPEEGQMKTDRMEIVKTDNGWKRTKYASIHNIEELVNGVAPNVIKELRSQ